jgi:HPr kinase/phosphorylase
MRRQTLRNREKPPREHPLNTQSIDGRIDSAYGVAHLNPAMILVHGTTVALDGDGVLLRGPSGSGKSDLALRLIDRGARLVADDQTELAHAPDGLIARSPASIAGRMEVRGVGILTVPTLPSAPLRLVVDLVAPDRVERLPEPELCQYLQHSLPLLALAPFEGSTPAKIRLALASLVKTAALPIVGTP